VTINGTVASIGAAITPEQDKVTLDGRAIKPIVNTITIMLNKPAGYVVSRDGQGSRTIYDLLPEEFRLLKPIGRLDKNSSGLLLMTNDGDLAHELTHPSRQKVKIYEVTLDQPLAPLHRQMISDFGVQLDDGPSKFQLERLEDGSDTEWRITLSEGRNRQIRRTFQSLGYKVKKLHRTHFGPYQLNNLKQREFQKINI
jgi:23S rRNA pseudouridine2605 synthase